MQKKINNLLEKGILISPELLEEESNLDSLNLQTGQIVINKIQKKPIAQEIKQKSKLEIVKSFHEKNSKKTIKDFVQLYNARYKTISSFLKHRSELLSPFSIRKVATAQENTVVSFIGIIFSLQKTKNDNFMIVFEDTTGTVKAVITKKNKELYDIAKDLTPDEVVGVTGTKGKGIVFVNNIILPDVPLNKELKKSPLDEAALFIGDIHIGSRSFLKENFEKFISWINGEYGSPEQKKLVKKIKYLFIMGDLVEGIGIYPNQENDLVIKDIYEQYKILIKYIKKIPENINIIICPGNHDSIRLSEPQPPVPYELIPDLYEQKNIFIVSSPSIIKIAKSENFGGIEVLLYHGFSFPYYASNIESIRMQGGLENTSKIMNYLIKKRHLAPTHGSTQYQMGDIEDNLVIKSVPDIFASGHIHRASIKNYRNITLLNCSCWISQTPYQEKRGLIPLPSRAIYIDLKTRQGKILNFSD